MSLNGIESTNGYLECITTNGSAVSNVITQDGAENDFSSIKNPVVNFVFANISTATASDIFTSEEAINDGDKLAIVLNDNSVNEVIATGVVAGGETLIADDLDAGDEDILIKQVSTYLTNGAYRAFSVGATHTNASNPNWLWRKIDTAGRITEVTVLMADITYSGGTRLPTSFEFQGSNDAISWDTLHSVTSYSSWHASIPSVFTMTQNLTNTYTYVRFYITAKQGADWYTTIGEMTITTDNDYSMDTTATTAGEIPDKVFRIDESILFNDIESTIASGTFNLDLELDTLSRATVGSYVDGGIFKYAAIDEARYEDGVLLVESAATNKIIYSTIFAGPNWYDPLSQWFYLSNAEISPDGTLNADRLSIEQDVLSGLIRYNTVSLVAGTYTLSFWFKDISTNIIDLSVDLGDQDLQNILSYFPGPFTDWTRVYCDITTTSTTSWMDLQMTFNSTFVNHDFTIWGVQLEVSQGNPTSAIYTNSGEVTRAADIVQYKDVLNHEQTLSDIDITGRTIETKVQMSAVGNKMIDLTSDIWKEVYS